MDAEFPTCRRFMMSTSVSTPEEVSQGRGWNPAELGCLHSICGLLKSKFKKSVQLAEYIRLNKNLALITLITRSIFVSNFMETKIAQTLLVKHIMISMNDNNVNRLTESVRCKLGFSLMRWYIHLHRDLIY